MSEKQRQKRLSDAVHTALHTYFEQMNGHATNGLYKTVLSEFEKPLFACVMEHYDGNQTKAAEVLGISRVTLRKKLQQYNLL